MQNDNEIGKLSQFDERKKLLEKMFSNRVNSEAVAPSKVQSDTAAVVSKSQTTQVKPVIAPSKVQPDNTVVAKNKITRVKPAIAPGKIQPNNTAIAKNQPAQVKPAVVSKKQIAQPNVATVSLIQAAQVEVAVKPQNEMAQSEISVIPQLQTKQNNASDFVSNKNKLEGFSRLLDALDEFNITQQNFHDEMDVIYLNYKDILESSKTANHYLLIALLDPYTRLRRNPFPDMEGKSLKKTYLAHNDGHVSIEKEIANICLVINPENEIFKKILANLFDCSSNHDDTNSALLEILNDGSLSSDTKQALSRLLHRDCIFSKPSAHLMRYPMMLSNIKMYLQQAGYNETDNADMFANLNESIKFIELALKKINHYKDFMSDLNRTERILTMCLDKELNDTSGLSWVNNADSYNSRTNHSDNSYQVKLQNIVLCVSSVINQVKDSISHVKQAKEYLLEGVTHDDSYLQTLNSYMSELLDSLIKDYDKLVNERTSIENDYTPGLVSGFTNYIFSHTSFLLSSAMSLWASEKVVQPDPIAALKEMKDHFDLRFIDIREVSYPEEAIRFNAN